jgi:hypothetical protein
MDTEAPSDCAVTELVTRVLAFTEVLEEQLGQVSRPKGLDAPPRGSFQQLDQWLE